MLRLGEVVAECLGIHSEDDLAAALERNQLCGVEIAPAVPEPQPQAVCSSEGDEPLDVSPGTR